MTLSRRRFLAATATLAAARLAPAEGAPVSSLARDPRRPQYHLLPARNWMNDPNGPIYWRGQYHMYFQYNPNAAVWGDMHWAHAVSPDMVHWAQRPVALAPTPGSADADGCFSGTAIVAGGRVAMLYTGVAKAAPENSSIRDGQHNFHEAQLLAWANDASLNSFTKVAAPVIPNPPEGMKVTGFRDPSPWRMGDRYWMTVGSGIEKEGGCVLLYSSPDLVTWKYEHIVARGLGAGTQMANPVDAGDMWECPELFALDGKHVLIYSTLGKVYWQVGVLDEKEMLFHAETHGLLDAGSFYASKSQVDREGRRILWGWVQETRPEAEFSAAGWAGMMSLPRVLRVGPDNRLRSRFLPELEKLRGREGRRDVRTTTACSELAVTLRTGTLTLQAPGTVLTVSFDRGSGLAMDGKQVELAIGDGPVELSLYIDGSVVEVCANGQVTYTKRFYYAGDEAPAIAVAVTGDCAVRQWPVRPISSDRLTS